MEYLRAKVVDKWVRPQASRNDVTLLEHIFSSRNTETEYL